MRIAVYGKNVPTDARVYIERIYEILTSNGVELIMYKGFLNYLHEVGQTQYDFHTFKNADELASSGVDFLLTIGGDGTILDAVTLVRDSGIPIFGINTGRLGFLANVAKEEAHRAVEALLKGNFSIAERSMIQMSTNKPELRIDPNFALNEVAVSRKGTTSMISVHTYINDEFLNTYWADGLIIATPTGSTGYSLSCGGPIIMPGSDNFVITPIAPHNLTVRPFVISNNYKITLKVETREEHFLTALDSRIYSFGSSVELTLERAKFKLKLVQTELQDFPSTLRNKLLWGLDRRN